MTRRHRIALAWLALGGTALGSTALSNNTLFGQASDLPRFEAASVKPAAADPASPMAMLPLVLPQPGGGLRASNAPLRRLVEVAYGVEDFQVLGGPPWATSQRFDIIARAPGPATLPEMQPMLRALLTERFVLKAHLERREMATFALVNTRADGTLGPDLKRSSVACTAPGVRCGVAPFGANGAFGMRGTAQTMATLVRLLSQAVGRPVLDQTGLAGRFDFEFSFDPSILKSRAAEAGVALPPGVSLPESDSPALATAIQQHLGLRLQTQRDMVDVVVIDSADLPVAD